MNDMNFDKNALFNIGYGLYVITCNDGKKDNGLIVNSVMQVSNNPVKIMVSISKQNYSHDVIKETKKMNVNYLTIETPFSIFAVRVLIPTLLIVAILGVLRGFFQGLGSMMPKYTTMPATSATAKRPSIILMKIFFRFMRLTSFVIISQLNDYCNPQYHRVESICICFCVAN